MQNKNLGVILEDIQPLDLVFGANERVEHNITIEDRKWLPYYSEGELQFALDDTMGCVTFSAIKVFSAKMNYMIQNKMLSIGNMQWLQDKGYLNKYGEFDVSERFTAAMSNTSANGNTGGAVWWSMRNHGLVPQSVCPWIGESGAWFRDKANITQEMKDIGLEFAKRFDILFERVKTTKEDLLKAIKHSPIQLFIPTACPYENTIQQYCTATITHAVSKCEGLEPRGYHPLFDHYIKQPQEKGQERFIRRVVENYPFYSTGYICNIAEKLDIDQDGYVEMEDRQGRLRRFPSYFVKTITYLVTKRGFKLKGNMNKLIKENWEKYLVSSVITFVAGFALYIVPNIDKLNVESFATGAWVGIVLAAVRSGVKVVLEAFLIWYKQKKLTPSGSKVK